MQPYTVASSENLVSRTDWSTETQSFVKRVNRKGDSTPPCIVPVFRMIGLERDLLTLRD